MKRIALVGLLCVLASASLFGQATPVVGSDDPAALFTDKDPVLNRNKQAAMHIVIDLLEAGHWSEADKWLTERYIQHNPNFSNGREPIMKAFGGRGLIGVSDPTDVLAGHCEPLPEADSSPYQSSRLSRYDSVS